MVSELEEKFEGKLIVRKVNLFEERDMGVEYSIRVVPTLILLDGRGDQLERREGYMSFEDIREMLAKHGIR